MLATTWGETQEYTGLLQATHDARLAYFRTLGEPDKDVWFPTAVPTIPGGPIWPGRPAWRRIRAGKQTIVSSSGLCDPMAALGSPNQAYGVEVALATVDEVPQWLHPSWLLDLAIAVSNQAAVDGRFFLRAEKFGTFLFGAPGAPDSYKGWLDRSGALGFLVGVPVPGIDRTMALPLGNAIFLMAKLLTPAEYEFVAQHGLPAAQDLPKRFAADGTHHLSSLQRKSVV